MITSREEVFFVVAESEALQLNVANAVQALQKFGLKAEVSSARSYYEEASRQWQALPTPRTETLWLQATIVYQAMLVAGKINPSWAALARIPQFQPNFCPGAETVQLYALALTNSAIGHFMAETRARESAEIVQVAVDCFNQVKDPAVNRWKGCALVLLARHATDKRIAQEYAREALGLFKKPFLPSLGLFAYAGYVAGLGDGRVPGRKVVQGDKRIVPFEPSDIFYFQS